MTKKPSLDQSIQEAKWKFEEIHGSSAEKLCEALQAEDNSTADTQDNAKAVSPNSQYNRGTTTSRPSGLDQSALRVSRNLEPLYPTLTTELRFFAFQRPSTISFGLIQKLLASAQPVDLSSLGVPARPEHLPSPIALSQPVVLANATEYITDIIDFVHRLKDD